MHGDRAGRTANMDDEAPKFTVSQIVLLQKLRQSGLTKNQILKGLDEMEKLDDMCLGSPGATVSTPFTNGNTSASPSSSCSNGPITNGHGISSNSATKDQDYHRNSTSPQSPPMKFAPTVNVPNQMVQASPLMFSAHHLSNGNQLPLIPPVGSWPSTSQAVTLATAASLLQNGFAHGNVPPTVYPGLINGRGLMRCHLSAGGGSTGSTIVEIDDEKVDITEELEELFRRDQAEVKEDIRKFIGERHISQSAIAKATKNAISQSYISQWLAQPQDISGQKKKAMYTWFIVERRKPPGMSNGVSQGTPVVYRNDMEQELINPLLLKSKRGARFTWPKECLSILENYYNSNSYPDECKREEISHACNAIIQNQKPGMILSDLDKVTTVKVYNWFANRRKDDKRRRHIEHVESMGHQQVIISPRRNSMVSPSPSCHSNDSHPEAEHNPSLNDKNGGVVVKREDPMSVAMEMAAVNNSILALVNPHHDDASHHDEDDYRHESSFDRAPEHHPNDHYVRADAMR
ncbi:homeobox-containing protein 1-like isoform X2 [Clavelina lepadiformis]|uniref:homeobox-containing protein 1-like isoform X2 n=1 Tax=Clavelina lepadiformis TaxID=159417 RepID=UPI0040411077